MLIKNMTNQQLWDEYRVQRGFLANADKITTMYANMGDRRTANKGVSMIFKATKAIDIIYAVARKRGVNLLGPRPE